MNFEKLFIVVFFTLVMPAAWMFLVPLAKRMRRESEGPRELPPRVVDELERLHARLAELEERVDFTERLLATRHEPEHLQGGGA
ncbi:MAG TPA: hypothetical protein VEI47_02380 [Gemmatimonadales bacterium]|nr:hypothetical protein [Gemmatimonadales bacterium]